jgi:cytoskeleton protein RodZ
MEKGSFGERLKRERELRGVSLEEVSAATRIGVRFLEALENEQWDQLPGGVFNRGFIRAVAHFLGLNEEALVGEYAAATHDLPAFAVVAKPTGNARRGIWPAIVIAVFVVLVVAGAFAYHHHRRTMARGHRAAASAASATAPAGSATAPTSGLLPTGTATAAPMNRGTAPASPAAAAAASNPAAPPMKLEIEVGRATHLDVTADGKAAFDGDVKPGQTLVYQAHEQFQVSAGDSSAVLLKLNGRNFAPVGPPDQAGSVTITREDLKKLEPGPL